MEMPLYACVTTYTAFGWPDGPGFTEIIELNVYAPRQLHFDRRRLSQRGRGDNKTQRNDKCGNGKLAVHGQPPV
jgi:hypothetical protein